MKHEESRIQEDIVSYFKLMGHLIFSVPNDLLSSSSSGKSAMLRMVRFKKQGLLPGVSDLILLTPICPFFIEIKTKTGKQTENQKAFQSEVEKLGYPYVILRSLEEAMELEKEIRD